MRAWLGLAACLVWFAYGCATIKGGTVAELGDAQARCARAEYRGQPIHTPIAGAVVIGPMLVAQAYHDCMRSRGWVQHNPITWTKE